MELKDEPKTSGGRKTRSIALRLCIAAPLVLVASSVCLLYLRHRNDPIRTCHRELTRSIRQRDIDEFSSRIADSTLKRYSFLKELAAQGTGVDLEMISHLELKQVYEARLGLSGPELSKMDSAGYLFWLATREHAFMLGAFEARSGVRNVRYDGDGATAIVTFKGEPVTAVKKAPPAQCRFSREGGRWKIDLCGYFQYENRLFEALAHISRKHEGKTRFMLQWLRELTKRDVPDSVLDGPLRR